MTIKQAVPKNHNHRDATDHKNDDHPSPSTSEDECEDPATDSSGDDNHCFSVDLESRCVRHFEFLETLHKAGVTQHATSASLRRYLLWLSLLAKMRQEEDSSSTTTNTQLLIPPMDVAWLWHCHRLAPEKYEEFLQQTCITSLAMNKSATSQGGTSLSSKSQNIILDWKDPAGDSYAVESNSFSRQLWTKYNPSEPFDYSPAVVDAGSYKNQTPNETLCGLDLLASAQSQAEFYWQIQPLFQSKNGKAGATKPTFKVSSAIQDYRRFLKLVRKQHGSKKSAFKLVPTYEIDLMWHTHMTGGSMYQYHSDCEIICGKLVDHDDSYGDGDRAEEAVLNQSFLRTAELWSQEYHDDTYAQKGGYRGAPPVDYYPVATSSSTTWPDISKPSKIDPESLVVDITKPTASSNATLFNKCSRKKVLSIAVSVYILTSVLLIILGAIVITPSSYVCGEAPTAQEIQARGAPVCLTTNVREGALCLKAGEDPNDPSVWCQENLRSTSSMFIGSPDFYLWWSPCTKCSTAWRMFWERDDDKSKYKHLEETQPEPTDVPSSSDWLEWDDYSEYWYSTYIAIETCPMEDVNEDGIPSACFVEQSTPALWATGLLLLGIPGAGLLIYGLIKCCQNCECNGGSSGGARSSSGGHYYGGGCGGGGGGGGCGGGGCGGC